MIFIWQEAFCIFSIFDRKELEKAMNKFDPRPAW